ncbi:MAG: hypothetical protein J6333_06165 [Planctomycetes bacterium]|nr:hypothetical protein [Planctomycetota bacterium]
MPDMTSLRPLTADLPPIVILSSLDFGGAGVAAFRLHQGILAAGADVKVVVISLLTARWASSPQTAPHSRNQPKPTG